MSRVKGGGRGSSVTSHTTGVFVAVTGDTMTGDLIYNDNVKILLGTGSDAGLYYDGTDVIWEPQLVGTGKVRVKSKLNNTTFRFTIETNLTGRDEVGQT